jgi:hypothetical protein
MTAVSGLAVGGGVVFSFPLASSAADAAVMPLVDLDVMMDFKTEVDVFARRWPKGLGVEFIIKRINKKKNNLLL